MTPEIKSKEDIPMKIVSEGNGLWAIEMPDGSRPVQHESYQVCSNIAEMSVNGLPEECDEVRDVLQYRPPR